MTISEILEQIYSFEKVLDVLPQDKDEELRKFLPSFTKLLAKFDICDELNNLDVRGLSDDKQNALGDILHNLILEIDREIFSRK